jgi:hypothetical protein
MILNESFTEGSNEEDPGNRLKAQGILTVTSIFLSDPSHFNEGSCDLPVRSRV